MNGFKSNMDKSSYETNLEIHVSLLSERILPDRCDDEKYFPQIIREKVVWFDFQGVMLHAAYKMKDTIMKLLEYLFNFFYIFVIRIFMKK